MKTCTPFFEKISAKQKFSYTKNKIKLEKKLGCDTDPNDSELLAKANIPLNELINDQVSDSRYQPDERVFASSPAEEALTTSVVLPEAAIPPENLGFNLPWYAFFAPIIGIGLIVSSSSSNDNNDDTNDTIAPTPAKITSQAASNDMTPEIKGSGEPGATVTVAFLATAETVTGVVNTSGLWAVTATTPLPAGDNSFNVTITDPAGNSSPATDGKITIDMVAPTAPTISSASGSNDTTPTITGTGEPGATANVTFPSTGETASGVVNSTGSWAVTPVQPLPTGNNPFTVTITDPGGNTSPSKGGQVIIDATVPTTPTITSPTDTNDPTPTITGTGESGATASVVFQTNETATGVANSSGNWAVTPTQPLATGPNQFTVTITDPGGNTSPATSGQIVIDVSEPSAPIVTSPMGTNDMTPTITGTGEPGATASVAFQTGETATSVANSSGNWAVAPSQPLASGANQFTVTITDPGGNTSPAIGAQIFVDPTPPAAPTISSPTGSNDLTPTITGTGEAGSTVQVVFPTGETATGVVNSSGNWTVTPTQPLTTGANTFTVTVTDPGGNTSPSTTAEVTIDTTAPIAPTVTPPAPTNDLTPTITGTGEAGSTVQAVFPTGETATGVVNSSGNWTVTPTQPLTTGANTFTVTVTDPGGNTSPSTAGQVTIDTTAPIAPTVTPPAPTHDLTPTITGTGEAGSTVQVVFPTGETATGVVNSSGNWTVTPTQPLTTGANTFTVTVTDPGGNTSPSTTAEVTIDTTAPIAPTVTPPAPTNDLTPTITGTGEAGSTVQVVLPTGETATGVVNSTGNWTVTPTQPLTTGANTFTVTVTDPGGNTSPSTAGQVTIDTTAPIAPTVTPPAPTNDLTPTITGTGEAGSTVQVVFPTGETATGVVNSTGNWTVTPTQPLTTGANTFTVTVTDPGGNTSPSTTAEVTIDTTAPIAPTVTPPAPTNDLTPTITGTGEAGSTVQVVLPTGETATGVVNSTGNWTVTPTQPLTTGANTFTVTVTDPGGNTSPSTAGQVTIDTTAPIAPTVTPPAPTNDLTPTITGTGEAGSTVQVVFPTGETATGVVNSSGNWTVTPTQPLTTGANTFTVTVTDPSGNTSPSTAGQVTIDTTAPTAPTVTPPAPTNDLTPTITGTGEAGSTVQIVFPTGETATGVVNSSGNWAVTPTQPLTTGANTFTVTVTDPSGNTSPSTAGQVTIDTTAPIAPTVTPPAPTNDLTPTITGTGEAGSTVQVVLPTGETATGVVNSSGNWTVTPTQPLTTGANTFTVTVTDPGGNTSPSTTAEVTIDTTAPIAPTVTPPAPTNDLTPTITGTGEAGSTVQVVLPTGETATGVVNSSGNWTVTPTQPLTTGANTFTVTVTDPGGNTSPSTTAEVTIDTTAPIAPTVTPPAPTNDLTPTITGTGEAGSTVQVVLPTGETATGVVNSSGNWTVTPTQPLTTGANTFTVTVTDPGGNTSPSTTAEVTIDTTAPIAPTVTPPAPTNDLTPTITGTGEAGSTVQVVLPTGETATGVVNSSGNWTVTPTQPLTTGANTFTVTVTDPGGNTSPSTAGQVTIDTTAPIAPTVTPPAPTNDLTPTITGTGEAGSTVQVVFPTGETATGVVNSSGNWTVTPTQPLTTGANTFTVTVTDPSGNTSPSTAGQVTIDTTAPTAPTVTPPAPTNDLTPTITGTGEAGSTVQVVFPTGETATGVVNSSGNWTVTPTQPLTTGANTFTVTVTDPGGNTSPSTAGQVTIDTTAPIAPTVTPPAPTNDLTPTITGTGEAGSTVQVVFPTGETATGVVNSSGNWTVTPTQPLTTGANTFTVTVTDPGGNASPSTAGQVTIDNTAPTAPTVTPPAPTNDLTPAITGTGEAGSTVQVVFPTGETATGVVNSSGNWTVTPTQPLTTGANTFTVTVTDPGGNTSPSTAGQVTIDTTAPIAPTVTPPAPTNDLTPTITGTGEAGSTVQVVFPTGETATGVVNSSGNWTVTPTQPLTTGANTFTVTVTDPSGNTSPSTAGQLTIDTTAPTAPTVTPPAPTNDLTPTITGTGEAGSTVQVVLPTGETATGVVNSSGNWTVTPTQPLTTGANTFTVTVTDPGGNTSPSTAGQVTIDTTAPIAPTVTPPAPTNDLTPTITGTGEAGSTVQVVFPTGETATGVVNSSGNWTVTPTQPLTTGANTFTVTVTDPGGNTSPSTAGQVTIDTTAPIAPTVTPPAPTNDLTPTITGTGEAGSTVQVVLPTGETATGVVNSSGNWTVTPTQPLTTGANTFTVTVTDPSGNTSPSTTAEVTIDTTAPIAPTVTPPAPTNDLTPTITGTGEAGSTVQVVLPTGETATGVVNSSGNWTVTPTQPLTTGANTFTVTVTDPSGNTSPSTAGQVTIDTTAPTAPTVTPPAPTNDLTPTITGTGEAGSTVQVVLPTGETATGVVNSSGNWTVTPTQPLTTGANTFTVTVTDPSGNTSPSTTAEVTIDTTAPTAPTVTPPAPTNDLTPTITGTGEAGSTVQVVLPTGETATGVVNSSGNWTVTPTQPLTTGANTFTVTVTDPSGNTSPSTAGQVTIDTTAPIAPTVTPPAPTNDLTPTITGTGEAGSTVQVVLPTGETATGVVNSSGNWTVTPTQPLTTGANTFTVTVTDPSGNTSPSTTAEVTIDTTAPAVPVIDFIGSINDSTPVIAGSAEASSTVEVTTPTGEKLTALVDANGHWTVTPTLAIAQGGPQTISVISTDSAGNSSSGSSNDLVVIVNDAPTAADSTFTINEDGTKTFSAADFGFSDLIDAPANNQLMNVIITTLPALGTLTISGVAVVVGQPIPAANLTNLVYTPPANAHGNNYANFDFKVQDNGGTANAGVDTSVATNKITINVTSVDDAPLGANSTITIVEDGSKNGFTAANFGFVDPFDDPANNLINIVITSLPAAGTLTKNGGQPVSVGNYISVNDLADLVYTPAAHANGNNYATLGFKVQDDGNAANFSATPNTITFNVTPVNDAPVNKYNGVVITTATPAILAPIDAGGLMTITGLTAYDPDEDATISQPLTPAGNGLGGGTGGSVVYTLHGPGGVALDNGFLKLNGVAGTVSGTQTTYTVGTATAVFDSNTAALTVTGSTLADINLAISKMQYQDNPASVGDVQMKIVTTDRAGLFDAVPIKISIPINDNQFLTNGDDGSVASPIDSGSGNDVVFGKSGSDVITGGADVDVIFGGFGSGVRNHQFDFWNFPQTGTGTGAAIDGGNAFLFQRFKPLTNGEIGWNSTNRSEYVSVNNSNKLSNFGNNGFYSLDPAALAGDKLAFSQNLLTAEGEAYTAKLTLSVATSHAGVQVGWNGVDVLTFTGANGIHTTAAGYTVTQSAVLYTVTTPAGTLTYYTYTISGLVGAAGSNATLLELKSNGTDSTINIITELTVDPVNTDADDTLAGGLGADYIWGQGGNDVLYGGDLNSTPLNTDTSTDIFAFNMRVNDGADIVKDFVVGVDQIYLINILDLNTTSSKFPGQTGLDNGGAVANATLSSDNNLEATDFTGIQAVTLSDGGTGLKLDFGNGSSIVLDGVSYEATAVAGNNAYGSIQELLGVGETKAVYLTGDSIPKGLDTIM